MIIVITGPTAVGKTKMSVELAKIYNGEIVNADSVQIYEGLDVGSAKATKEEMQHIKHHLLSIKDVSEDYSVFDYQIDARKKIEEIKSIGKIPIFVGGTGYYIKSVFYDYKFDIEEDDNNSPSKYNDLTNEELLDKILKYEIDFEFDKSNHKRLVRLLTKLESGWTPSKEDYKLLYDDVVFIGLTCDREVLYERINERFDKMLIPLIDEVKPFALKNIRSKALMTGIGYKEFYPFFNNEVTLASVVEECKKNSRNYAKRQYTWFNNQLNINWFNVDFENFSKTISEVSTFIDEYFRIL